jgi:Protein of unknown function (DUF3306)
MSTIEEGFLSRWSRRKRAAGTADPPADASAPAPSPAEALPDAATEFDFASLPSIESLTAETDITPFLRAQVPAALRSAALRRVWTLDPVIRDFVGPADYAWDYNAADGMAGFSLELGGDVKKLLAQAIGLVEEDAEPPQVGTPLALTEAPKSDTLVLKEVPPGIALADSASADTVSSNTGPADTGPANTMLAGSSQAPASSPPRRHGGARPT